MLKLLNGPHTFGSGPVFWVGFVVVIALVLAYPLVATPYDVGNFAYFFIWLFMALGLCLMWGYGGIMSFGQTFFFGLAGYGYGVIAINLGGKGFTTFEALGLAVLLSGAAAAILGYFMIWGRVGWRVLRHRDAGLVACAGVLSWPDRRSGMEDWARSPQWLQWHEGHEGAQHSMGRAYPRL